MKKIFYLLSVACMLVACNDSIKTGNGTEPTGLSVQSEGTAGAKVTVTGQGISKDAKFYLAESKAELDAEILESGAEVTLPYTLGEFTLNVEQDGTSYTVGKITVAITGIVLPEEAETGAEITITANGFAEDAAIFFGSEDTNASLNAGSMTLTVPQNAVIGENTVIVKQAGTEQELGKINVKEAKTRKLVSTLSVDMFGSTIMGYSIKYSGNKPVSITDIYDSEYSIASTNNVYSFSGPDAEWQFTISNDRVEKITIDKDEHSWEYDANGHLSKFWCDNYYPYSPVYDADGNYDFGFIYDPQQVNKPDAVDFGALFGLAGQEIEESEVIYVSAALLGWAGAPSTNLPSELEGLGECMYTFDQDGYVTNISIGGMVEISCTYAN